MLTPPDYYSDDEKAELAANQAQLVGHKITHLTQLHFDNKHVPYEAPLNREGLWIRTDAPGSVLLYDRGQTCYEDRYITIDDDLSEYIGATITGLEEREYRTVSDEGCYVHDAQTVVIHTDRGPLDLVTHVDHNGYYGGFDVCLRHFDASDTHDDGDAR